MELIETFNARYLNYEEIACSFIPNRQFDLLNHTSHSILIGPRGCGKTTLLKMLYPQSISFWNKHFNRQIELPFISVYIPTDKQWEKQLNILTKNLSTSFDASLGISRGLFNLNVQISLLNVFIDLKIIHDLEDNFEFKLAKELIDVWELKKNTPSTFYSIKKELRKRIKYINNEVNRIDSILNIGSEIQLPNYCNDDFMDLVESACDAFEETSSGYKPLKKKWALCFDELEIAPKWLQEDLIRNRLRSSPHRFIFKLTTSPIINVILDKGSLPTPNNDFRVIPSWIYNKEQEENWRNFSNKLMSSKIKLHLGEDVDLSKILGEWNMDRAVKQELGKYSYNPSKLLDQNTHEWEENTLMWYVIKRLSNVDSSFKDFLISKGINPEDPVPVSSGMIDSIHRKIKSLVIFRFYFKSTGGLRSRNRITLYHGFDFIYKFSDGNPRTLINLINEFIPLIKSKKSKKGNYTKIPLGLQAAIFQKLSEKNSTILKIIQMPTLDLINQILILVI